MHIFRYTKLWKGARGGGTNCCQELNLPGFIIERIRVRIFGKSMLFSLYPMINFLDYWVISVISVMASKKCVSVRGCLLPRR